VLYAAEILQLAHPRMFSHKNYIIIIKIYAPFIAFENDIRRYVVSENNVFFTYNKLKNRNLIINILYLFPINFRFLFNKFSVKTQDNEN